MEGRSQSNGSESINKFLTQRISPFLIEDSLDAKDEVMLALVDHIQMLDELKERRQRLRDDQFLKVIFFRTHRKFLERYDPSSTFSEMVLSGKYGCLPGTVLYALLLEYFDFKVRTIELTNHIFLKVKVDDQIYTFESTDPSKGFIRDDVSITQLSEQFEANSRRIISISSDNISGEEGQSTFVNQGLTFQQMAGLQFYNQSVYAYYKNNPIRSLQLVNKAVELYESDRTTYMMEFVISTILRNKKISGVEKENYLKQYIRQVKKKRLSQTLPTYSGS